MVTGNKARKRIQSGRWPCGCCGRVIVNGGRLEKVKQFCYLRDVLDCEAEVEKAVQVKITAAYREVGEK